MRLHRTATELLLLAPLIGAPAMATPSAPSSTLGPSGEVYQARLGSYGQLFAEGSATDPGSPVLALDVLRQERLERWLVPGTETIDVETSASVMYESGAETVYVVWTTNFNFVHSRINVIGFHAGEWSDPIEVVGDPFSLKSSPRIAVTRDTLVRTEAGAVARHRRTILHALWWEESGDGDRIVYAPLVLVDGVFIGETQWIALDELAPGGPSGTPVPRQLALAPGLDDGDSPQRLLASFALPRSGNLSVLEIEPVPLELVSLGSSARAHIVEVGARACQEEPIVRVGESARAHIVEVGRNDFHSSVIRHVATVATESLGSAGSAVDCGSVESVGAEVERQVVQAGMDTLRNGLLKKASAARAHIVEVGRSPDLGIVHKVRIQQTAQRPAPPSGDGDTYVFASRDGRRSLVAWHEQAGLVYVESLDDGSWSEPTLLRTDDLFEADEAIAVLRRRVAEP
jgi:hypothetical protein